MFIHHDKMTERREFARVKLIQPLRGRVGTTVVYIVDVSLSGIRVAHQEQIPTVNSPCTITFEWDGQPVKLNCTVKRTRVERLARKALEKTLYHSGLEIVEKAGASEFVLRRLIEDCVTRALDEQRANARGIPAIAAQSFQTGKGSELMRCELVNGHWKSSKTTDPEQPENGFTISADEDQSKVDMLRAAFESGDAEGRRLIRTFAALSISKSEGIPTRRYTP